MKPSDIKLYLWIAGGLAAGMLVAGGARAAIGAATKKAPPTSILLLGDSLAVGLGSPFSAIAANNGVAVDVHAVSGKTAVYWQPYVQDLLNSVRPDMMLVSLGTNDATASNPAAYVEAIKSICSMAKSSGVRLTWILPPPLPLESPDRFPSLEAVNQAIVNCSPEVIDVSGSLQAMRAGDGIHFTAQGYAAWAKLIWQEIDS